MTVSRTQSLSPIPATAGIGLRLQHMPMLAVDPQETPPRTPWLEVHSENFLNPGGPRQAMLADIRQRYPMSCHGVGLSLGSAEGLDLSHLRRLKNLFSWVKPALLSEHLSWSVVDGAYLNDLLPLPYTEETLRIVSANVARAQDTFGHRLLIENPSSYLSFAASTMPEWDFLAQLVKATGCGLLLDVNNIYVSASNNAFDAHDYLAQIDMTAVGEIHLAGHSIEDDGETRVLVDTHSTYVCDPVWALYRAAVTRRGPVPTLIEWDMDIPAFEELQAEAMRAQAIMDSLSNQERARVA